LCEVISLRRVEVMIQKLKVAVVLIWMACVVCAGAAFGGMLGWAVYGWPGAIGFGLVSAGVGAVFAVAPLYVVDLVSGFPDATGSDIASRN
jgi:hypothetical protein